MSLIVIDGLDGSGKATQTKLLAEHFENAGKTVCKVTFPDYDSEACGPVKMYLRGDFGTDPSNVNAYAASSFYAVDRYASFNMFWSENYKKGETILCDRYSTSNAIHQMTKLPKDKWDEFLDWHYDFEFVKLGIPVPDTIIYLDMDPAVSKKLISSRYDGDEGKRDIHEKNFNYLLECREAAFYVAKKQGWNIVHCSDGENPYTIEKINSDIIKIIEKV